jgi:hypothetical protein
MRTPHRQTDAFCARGTQDLPGYGQRNTATIHRPNNSEVITGRSRRDQAGRFNWPVRCRALIARADHSHSMVPGGLLVTSSTTRLTARTSLVIRVEMVAMTSYDSRAQSAVIASSLVTGRNTIGWP